MAAANKSLNMINQDLPSGCLARLRSAWRHKSRGQSWRPRAGQVKAASYCRGLSYRQCTHTKHTSTRSTRRTAGSFVPPIASSTVVGISRRHAADTRHTVMRALSTASTHTHTKTRTATAAQQYGPKHGLTHSRSHTHIPQDVLLTRQSHAIFIH